jgi:hypothetical protein
MTDGDGFYTFMNTDVASRLHDEEATDEFEAHLRALPTTGFGRDNLNELLLAEIPEERDWAIGEAIAESHLEREHHVVWPWNMARDKRTPKASLPGADLVGMEVNESDIRLVLGEVKSSSEDRYPPQLMSGRSGHMGHQIDALATDLGLILGLIKWLWFRCKNTEHQSLFDAAVAAYLNSGSKSITLFGVLVRDTQPTELDLKTRGQKLAVLLQDPTTCHLIAIYLPCAISDLPAHVSGGRP